MNNIAVGMLVVVVHCDEPDHRPLIGQFGTVRAELTTLEQMLTNGRWHVELPNAADFPCPQCKQLHNKGMWVFNSHELRPVIDPDEAEDRITEKELDEELVT